MPTYDRSGSLLGTLKVGRWRCLRQELLHTGESMDSHLRGSITMAALREPMAVDIHATIATFFTPMRYLVTDWANMLKEGVDTTTTIPTSTVPTLSNIADTVSLDSFGLGWVVEGDVIPTFFATNINDIYNWYMKYPDDSDVTLTDVPNSDAVKYGRPAVNLPSYLTRLRKASQVTKADYQVAFSTDVEAETVTDDQNVTTTTYDDSSTTVDLRVLRELRARLASETSRDWFGTRGYKEVVDRIWGMKPSNEVEQRPWLLDVHTGWLGGSNVWATDGSSLGQRAGVMSFDLDHRPGSMTAVEAGVISYWLCLRFPPLIVGGGNPFSNTDDWTYADWTAEPMILAAMPPQNWKHRQLIPSLDRADVEGIYPAGQQWRTGWNQVDNDVSVRASFPIQPQPADAAASVYAARYHPTVDQAFISNSLGHGLLTVQFSQMCSSRVPVPESSIFAGSS